VTQPSKRRKSRWFTTTLLAFFLLAFAALVAVVVYLPDLVKRRCIAAAAEQGIALTIGSAQIGFGELHLSNVGFQVTDVPQITGTAQDVDVTLAGLVPKTLSARGVAIAIDGPFETVSAAIDKWRAARLTPQGAGAPAGTPPLEKITVQSGSLGCTHALGPDIKIEGAGLTAESDGRGIAFRIALESTSLVAARGTIGPWRVTLNRDAQGERTQVVMDPSHPDGANATWTKSATGAIALKVTVPRSPLASLGLPPALVGLAPYPPTQAQATIDFDKADSTRAELKAEIALFGARFGGAPAALDVRLDLAAAGDPAGVLGVTKGDLTVGPFKAKVAGSIALLPDGARIALAWKTTPIPCATLAQQMAAQSPLGDVGAQLGALAQSIGSSLGVARITGDARASGQIAIDSRNLGDAHVTITSSETCDIALFH
jgi:hypothetical protein